MVSFYIKYICDGKHFAARTHITPHFRIKSSFSDGRLIATLHTKHRISIQKFQVILSFSFEKNHRCFVNGYQSWTDSREYRIDEKMSELTRIKEMIAKNPFIYEQALGRAGDMFFCSYPRKKGVFYGYSYGYVRLDDRVDLFASLEERTGYTIIRFNARKSQAIAEKDFEGVVFTGTTQLIDFVYLRGTYDEVFDRWFSLMHIQSRTTEHKSGYTTWYNYYRNIHADIVQRDLKALYSLPKKIDIFQIDDGYQKNVGDWLHTDSQKFPDGMKKTAKKIHDCGMLAGLWLAPFAAAKDSFIYKMHPDWLIRDKKGRLYPAGANWGGFYAIDFYHPEAAAYIRHVFDIVLREWGYDMVKLDFLYAACVMPMHNRSRGQIMCEAMDFIRDCVGDKLILACGVPLMPCFGKVDFCRVGEDVGLEWSYAKHMLREDVSTPNSVNNTIFRRGLNGRAFLNDPDVFFLRENNIKMDFQQKKLLAQINGIFGSLLFVSDDVSLYNAEQLAVFLDTIRQKDVKILKADLLKDDIIHIAYVLDGKTKTLTFNYKNGKQME